MQTRIKCPHCSQQLDIEEAVRHQLEEKLRSDVEQGLQAEVEEKLQQGLKELEAQKADLTTRLEEERTRLAEEQAEESRRLQAALKEESDKHRRQLESLQAEKEEALAAEREKIAAVERQKSALQYQEAMQAMKDELANQGDLLREKHKKEVELMQQNEKLRNEQAEEMRKMQREMIDSRRELEKQLRETFEEHYRLRERDQAKLIDDLKTQISTLQQKAEQGSMQAQGEVQELYLEEMLKEQFPDDEIIPITTGKRGGDVLHVIRSGGQQVGRILWESKRTKNFSPAWAGKLKEDCLRDGADLAVLVSQALPKEIGSFGQYEGIWVSDLRSATGLALALRHQLAQVFQSRTAIQGQSEKMVSIYRYLTGSQFAQRVQTTVEIFTEMKEDLDKEKRALERSMAKREKQLDKVVLNVAGLVGDIQGMGAPVVIDEIPSLQLPGTATQADPAVEKEINADLFT